MNPLVLAGVSAIKHSVMRTVSVVCVLLVVAGLAWAVYAGIIRPVTKPNPATTQNASQINNYYIYPNKKGFSLLSWGTWHLLSKDTREINPIIKQNEQPIEIKK